MGSDAKTPALEWIAASLGIALPVGIVGYLIWDGLHVGDAPADLVAQVGTITPGQQGFTVDVAVTNRGGQAAAAAKLVGRFPAGSESMAQAETTFDYLPGHSTRHGTLVFHDQPQRDRLAVWVVGFRQP